MKVKFDPSNSSHLKSYRIFLKHKTWLNGCIFELEWPYHDIPVMIQAKIIDKYLDKLIQITGLEVNHKWAYTESSENKTKRQPKSA